MRLKRDFVVHEISGEWVLIPVGAESWRGVLRGNKTMGAMLELLKEETTTEELTAALRKRFDAPEGMIERDIARIVAELEKIGASE